MHKNIQFRPVADQDRDLLRRIYASTRELELQQTDWSDEQKQAFIEMQFNAQHAFYREHYYDARFDIVLYDGVEAGRLYVWNSPKELLIVDITLLPEFRGKGIGTELLEGLLREAQETGRSVQIHVEKFNPALGLYSRLGFKEIGDEGVYFHMEWRPEALVQA